jgi:molybdenum-dependent DNA-binding transcriptional regulator ModE
MHPEPTTALTLQFLTWIAAASRSYGDVMEAWRTTCPRMTVWEDAVSERLVAIEHGRSMKEGKVKLTARGRALLAAQPVPTDAEVAAPQADSESPPAMVEWSRARATSRLT